MLPSLRRTLVASITVVVAGACRDSRSPVSPVINNISHAELIAAARDVNSNIPPLYDLDHVAGSRKLEEESATIALMERSTPEEQANWRKVLNPEPGKFSAVVGIRDPEKKRLYEKITAIRRADMHAREREKSKAAAKKFGLTVTLALVDPTGLGDSRARIVRDLNWTPWSVILLRRGEATPEDVVAGLAMMAKTREQVGDYIPQPHRLVFDVSHYSGTMPAGRVKTGQRLLTELENGEIITLPEYGEVRSTKVWIGPVKEKNTQ
jgi:hypothetical protein